MGKNLSILFKVVLVSLLALIGLSFRLQPTQQSFYDSKQIAGYLQDTVFYHPNTTIIPSNSKLQKIQMSIDGNIDGIIVYLRSPDNKIIKLSGFTFSTRAMNRIYVPAPGNMIKRIYFATHGSNGKKFICGIKFSGTLEQTPFYMGRDCTDHVIETIYLEDAFVGFYGHLFLKFKTILGIGVVMQKQNQ